MSSDLPRLAKQVLNRLPRRLPTTGRGWITIAVAVVPLVIGLTVLSGTGNSEPAVADPATQTHTPGQAPKEPSSPASPRAPESAAPTISLLNTLPVKGKAAGTGYDRAQQFGPKWSDAVDVQGGRNGCDTRNDVRRRDLTDAVIKPGTRGCKVTAGTLAPDKYTGKTVPFEKIQIDHIVALKNAWVTGAQQIPQQKRIELANDPLNLLAVDGATNQSKGDRSADAWLPPNKSFRCEYVTRQIMVKSRYELWVTEPEKNAMLRILATCPPD